MKATPGSSRQFSSLQKEIDDRNLEIEKLKEKQQKLNMVIRSLEKDIKALKREIQERDGTIQDKVCLNSKWDSEVTQRFTH